jgi:hypothetical protein
MRWLVLAILVAPAAAWGIYRLAKELGFLDPPWNQEHEQRRTIVVAMFAFLLLLPIFLFGWAAAWPRVWAMFGVVNGLALAVFAVLGILAVRRLWRLRHPSAEPMAAPAEPSDELPSASPDSPSEKPLV